MVACAFSSLTLSIIIYLGDCLASGKCKSYDNDKGMNMFI